MSDLIRNDIDDVAFSWETLILMLSVSSRKVTNTLINPNLVVHDDYTSRESERDDHRTAFSQFRISAH